MAEDFTSWVEYADSSSKLSQTSSRASFNQLPRDYEAALYKDFGSGYITDFQIDSTINANTVSTSSFYRAYFMAVSNEVDDGFNLNDGIKLQFFSTSQTIYTLRLEEVGGSIDLLDLSYGTDYYIDFDRSGTTATCSVYTDSGKTLPVSGSPLSIAVASSSYQYGLVTLGSVDAGAGTRICNGYVDTYTLTISGTSGSSIEVDQSFFMVV